MTNGESELADGEVDIWIPNKKYKGPLRKVAVETTAGSKFASFQAVDTPPAFVKKVKSAQTDPKSGRNQLKTTGPSSAPEKKVKFVVSKNQSQSKNLLILPVYAFIINMYWMLMLSVHVFLLLNLLYFNFFRC